MDQTDALEDWVAIKDHPFLDTNKPARLEFLVAWNEVDWKIAVTCRERSRVASDSEVKGWSRLFGLSELQSIHDQLALVHPSLGPLMPRLPEEPRGIWSYITPPYPPSDDLCGQLTVYLKRALDICGSSLLTSTLFEEHDCEEYFENISELRRRTYDEKLDRADDELKNILFLRSGAINMLDMAEVYSLEDQAIFKLNIALAELYNYLIQPFLDMREMAFDKLREARNGLKNPNLGRRRKDELAAVFAEWNENYTHALDRIQELYIEYYQKTVAILSDIKERMLEDKAKFGKKTFEVVALDRFNRVCEDLTLEKLQLLKNTKHHYDNQREKVKQKIASLDAESVSHQLEPLEQDVYSWQRRVYDVQLEISQLEEQLVREQLCILMQRQSGEELEFFDAVETEEDLQKLADCEDAEFNKIKSLKKKMGIILKKRAQIRNRYKKLESDKVTKEMQKVNEEEKFKQHHSIKMKHLNQASALEEKQEFIKEERRKTLQRLKEYKMRKYPVPSTIKPRKVSSARTKKFPKQGHSDDHTDAKGSLPHPTKETTQSATSELNSHQPSDLICSPPAPPCPPAPPLPMCPPPPVCPPPPPCPPPPTHPSGVVPQTLKDVQLHAVSQSQMDKQHDKGDSMIGISLAHIQNAKEKLKKVSESQNRNHRSRMKPGAAASVDPMTDVLQFIKQGVKLRPVSRDKVKDRSEVGSPKHIASPGDSHTQHLMDAIERISKRLHSESDDEGSSDTYDDFD